METLSDKLYKELEDERKKNFESTEKIRELEQQMEALARDLKGVARLIDCMHNIDEFCDKEATISAFNNINRLIVDIASSMEATISGNDFYIS
jgi:hypothetical protein